ncbi:RibD family protein [Nocardia takedensis]|uniref:RibD family protein n=1 Tax=Nocardia takedensis TaxID=259390 RepID=UPI0003024CCE|nr:dihydrofolate reductase family protein [Nocardia takedensis]
MTARPYVLLSVATSLDGFIDDASPRRLVLSGAADLDRVDGVRAESDAILIGAGTLRADDPRLLVNSAERRAARVAAGLPEYPLRVVVSGGGDLDPRQRLFQHGGDRLVYTTDAGAARLGDRLSGLADVVALGPAVDFGALLDDLGRRGVRRLMVEGGTGIHTAFLAADLADELHLALAPLLVGDADAPRFVGPAAFPGGSAHRMTLLEVRAVEDVVVLRYAPRGARTEVR